MRKITKELQGKKVGELEKEVNTLREEIARYRVDAVANQPKDKNVVQKKKKRLAQVLTIISVNK